LPAFLKTTEEEYFALLTADPTSLTLNENKTQIAD